MHPRTPGLAGIRIGSIAVIALALVGALGQGCVAPLSQPTTTPSRAPSPVEPSDSEPSVAVPEPEVASTRTDVEVLETPPAVEVLPEPDPEEMTVSDPVSPSPLDELSVADPQLVGDDLARQRERVASPPTFDIPIEINDRVLAWVDRYSGMHRTSFEAGLRRSGRYLETFRQIFAMEGVPQDLVYMAHVESGYKTSAYSRAHARGVYQFIAATGRRYGLRVDYWVDERADPEKSARAAARYMKDLYEEFGDWYLALAAYNAGEGKIRRAIARSGKRDFWGIERTRYIRRETKNHIPAILAATLMSKEPAKYGFGHVVPEPLLLYDTITVRDAADLRVIARCAGAPLETLRELNPALRRNQTPPDALTDVRVPYGSGPATRAALDAVPPGERILYARHRVRRGDTLSEIARRYGVGVPAIQQTNGMGRQTLIRVNQVLLVPTSAASRFADVAGAAPANVPAGAALTYRVRRGDTLYAIARRYDTTPRSIAAASGIHVNALLRVGARLTVVPGVRSSTTGRRIAVGGGASASGGSGRLVHTVRRGDTLWRIASRYGTSVRALCSLNDISPNATIYPGAKLTVGQR